MTADDLWRIARVGTPSVSRSGKVVVAGVTRYDVEANEGRERLHLFAGGKGIALTTTETSSGQPAVSPDGRALAFVRKPTGKEHGQLFVMSLEGGEARSVTDLPLGVCCPRWMPDGRRILVLAGVLAEALSVEGTRKLLEERAKLKCRPHVTEDRVYRFWDHWLTDGEVLHVFVVDPTTGEVRDLTPGSRRWFDLMDPEGQLDVSPDGDEVVFSASQADPPMGLLRQALHAVALAPGSAVRCLTPDNPADDVRPRYSPDGRFILFGTKRDLTNYADRVRLARLERPTLEQRVLTEDWDRSATSWELVDATTAVVEVEERGRSCLARVDVSEPGRAPAVISDDGTWHAPTVAGDGYVYAQRSTLRSPPEVARVPVAGGAPEVVSEVNRAWLEEVELGRVEEVTFEGAGGRPVQMWLVYPPGYRGGPAPLLQVLHGGPYGAHHDGWHFRWNAQALVAPGYVGAFVNFHGSSGFGQAFSDAIHGDWGGRAARDILAATDLLVDKGIADPRRMALLGGSFGGYMTCWLATQTDRFACAIAHAAVYDLAAIMGCDVTQGLERELGGSPWNFPEDREAVARFDPAAWTGAYKTPTMVVHGARDYRVPVEQGLALYGMLKAKEVPARLVVYPEENHWVLKPQSSLHWYREVHAWLERWLRR